MPKVTFKFDKEKDLYNIWETCNYKSKWSDFTKNIPVFTEMCKDKKFEDCKKDIEEFNKEFHKSPLIEVFADSLNKSWGNINDEFFRRLERIMKKPIVFDKVMGYITSMVRCPYNPDIKNPSFMTSIFKPLPHALMIAAHEIMHIQFHNTYWFEIEKQIGKEKTADLKEALTVLLNLEFKDLWFVRDEGYEAHQELRKFIEKEWKKKSDFDVLMKKCVEYLKK